MKRIGLVGARGHVGQELMHLVLQHPGLELAAVTSRERAGEAVAAYVPGAPGSLRYRQSTPEAVEELALDAWVLALPNAMSASYVGAIGTSGHSPVIIDLSADHRFDAAWHYGLPELTRTRYAGERLISNPGCYATAMQLAIAPMRACLSDTVQCFGVSGYSGAGTTPSERNNPNALRDNFMPYALTRHVHEREVSHHCAQVEFMPHVASHFRSLSVTCNLHLNRVMTRDEIIEAYQVFYAGEALIEVCDDIPHLRTIAGRHGAQVGGFAMDESSTRVVVVATLDNLLKGAASQCMQNLNLALGFDELTALEASRP